MISLRLRVKMRTSPSRRWAWMRAPSSFHSTDAGPVAVERRRDVGGRRRQHRLHGPPGHHADGGQRASTPPVSAARGGRPEVAGEHVGPPHRGDRDAGRLGDGVDHHAVERALAQLAAEHPHSSSLLGLGRPAEHVGEQRPPGRVDAGSRHRRQPVDGPVDLEHRQRRRRPPARRRTSRSVAHPTPMRPWRRRAGEHADGDRDLVGRRAAAAASASSAAFSPRLDVAASRAETRRPARRTTRPSTVRPLRGGPALRCREQEGDGNDADLHNMTDTVHTGTGTARTRQWGSSTGRRARSDDDARSRRRALRRRLRRRHAAHG